ncbi:MAG: trigger factor [Candidatus Omnitrophota bacterium]|nr:trigger factor [Candidatus Omnitrophota bacterium]
MKYKVKQVDKTKKVIEMHISRKIVSGELDKICKDISKTASLPGYRAGKAPVELVKKRYKNETRDEAVKTLLADSFKKAITESGINMLGSPSISDLQFDEERGMSYKAAVNTWPQIKLKAYKGLKLKRKQNEVKESDVDSRVNSLREANAGFITKEGSAAAGDYLICDIDCAVEGHSVEKKKNAWLYAGEGSFIPGSLLRGLRCNDEKDVEKVLPGNYSKKEIAGKKALFHIKVREVKKKVLPEPNDEFARAAGKFQNMAELKEAVRENIKRKMKEDAEMDMERQALDILNSSSVFDVPQFMVDKQFEYLIEEAKKRLKAENLSGDELFSREKEFRDKLKKDALKQVRRYFILNEIVKLNNITAGDADVESAFAEIAGLHARPPAEVKKYYNENDLMENLKEDIRQKKAIDFIIKNASIE